MNLSPRDRVSLRSGRRAAFTLLELLIVMAIIGILAGIALPALKGIGQSNAMSAASRQLVDDLAYARMRAINDRTTVYVVFVPPQIIQAFKSGGSTWKTNETAEFYKLFNGQYTTYALYANRSLGDQPGPGTHRYLTEWKTLPEGVFIATNKFMQFPSRSMLLINNVTNIYRRPFLIFDVPFPLETSATAPLPCVAFNYQGQLLSMDGNQRLDEFIPLSRGSIIYPQSQTQPGKYLPSEPEVIETPRGNATNSPIVHVDWLTGRVKSETQEL